MTNISDGILNIILKKTETGYFLAETKIGSGDRNKSASLAIADAIYQHILYNANKQGVLFKINGTSIEAFNLMDSDANFAYEYLAKLLDEDEKLKDAESRLVEVQFRVAKDMVLKLGMVAYRTVYKSPVTYLVGHKGDQEVLAKKYEVIEIND